MPKISHAMTRYALKSQQGQEIVRKAASKIQIKRKRAGRKEVASHILLACKNRPQGSGRPHITGMHAKTGRWKPTKSGSPTNRNEKMTNEHYDLIPLFNPNCHALYLSLNFLTFPNLL